MNNVRPQRLAELFGTKDGLSTMHGKFVLRWPETETPDEREIKEILRKALGQYGVVLADTELVRTEQIVDYPNSIVPKRRTYHLYIQVRYDPNKAVDTNRLKSAVISNIEPLGAKVGRAELGECVGRNEDELMNRLLEKLRGKPVYNTLRKISDGRITSGPKALKGLFSLGTHIAIEVDQGNLEYRTLMPIVCRRIESLLTV